MSNEKRDVIDPDKDYNPTEWKETYEYNGETISISNSVPVCFGDSYKGEGIWLMHPLEDNKYILYFITVNTHMFVYGSYVETPLEPDTFMHNLTSYIYIGNTFPKQLAYTVNSVAKGIKLLNNTESLEEWSNIKERD